MKRLTCLLENENKAIIDTLFCDGDSLIEMKNEPYRVEGIDYKKARVIISGPIVERLYQYEEFEERLRQILLSNVVYNNQNKAIGREVRDFLQKVSIVRNIPFGN